MLLFDGKGPWWGWIEGNVYHLIKDDPEADSKLDPNKYLVACNHKLPNGKKANFLECKLCDKHGFKIGVPPTLTEKLRSKLSRVANSIRLRKIFK